MLDLLQKLVDLLLYIPKKIIEGVLDAVLAILNSIPVPDWIYNIPDGFAALGSTVWYFLSAAQVGYGFTVIVSAYTLRFLLRRIPFIG